jgi:hypothetical protein
MKFLLGTNVGTSVRCYGDGVTSGVLLVPTPWQLTRYDHQH